MATIAPVNVAAGAVVATADVAIKRTADAFVANKEDEARLNAIESEISAENIRLLNQQERKDEILTRFGPGPEDASTLASDAAKAEASGFPHGVSVTAIPNPRTEGRSAPRSEVQKHFEVRNTGKNPFHRTVVLPKPVKQQDAATFNQVFVPKKRPEDKKEEEK